MRFFLRLLPAHDLLTLPTIRWLVLSRFCANIFFYSTTIVLFQQQRGLNLTAMFLMESFLSGAIWIADVPTSIWADRFSYRHMIILGRIFSLVGILCFVLFYGFWIFALANILSGFSIACTSGSESALLYSSLSPQLREKRGKSAFALLSVASTGGLFLGLMTVAKFHRLSYTILNILVGTSNFDGKTRTETLTSGCSGSRTGFTPHDRAAMDQSRAYSGGAGRSGDAHSTHRD